MTPGFRAMLMVELRQYAIEHWGNESQGLALREMLDRRDLNAPKYNLPDTEEDWMQTAETLRRKMAGELWKLTLI